LLIGLESTTSDALSAAFGELESWALEDCKSEGLAVEELRFQRAVDVRYVGQGYELTADVKEEVSGAAVFVQEAIRKLALDFNRLHEQRYGYADSSRAIEIVNIRLRARVRSDKPVPTAREISGHDASAGRIGGIPMTFEGVEHDAPIYDRERLLPGNTFDGPALVVEYSTTTVVPPDYSASLDSLGNLILRMRDG